MQPKCECCGNHFSCDWQDCEYPHFCKSCSEVIPKWHEREKEPQPQTNVGLPVWVKHKETGKIMLLMHHPCKSHKKITKPTGEPPISTGNDSIRLWLTPLPDYPDSERESTWRFLPKKEVHGIRLITRKEHLNSLGKKVR